MTWDSVRDPIPMNMRDPVVPGSAIPIEKAFTMRRTPRDEMTTGEAEAYARGRADALAEVESAAVEAAEDVAALFDARPGPIVSWMCLTAWRPIETAPRDGREALVWHPDPSREGDAYIVGVMDVEPSYWAGYGYTHWMPLPPPPEHARAGAPEAADGAGGMGGSPDAPDAASGPHSHRDGGA